MPSKKRLFVTGNSLGLGLGLSEAFLARGWEIYGCSRRGCPLPTTYDAPCDLTDFATLGIALDTLLQGVNHLDLVILNAGAMGEFRPIGKIPVDRLRDLMELNVWANKVILDWLSASGKAMDQVVLISFDPTELGSKGWGGCALTKSTLNMLARLYAYEMPGVHVSALSPGLIASPMMDELLERTRSESSLGLERLRVAREGRSMLSPREAAERIYKVLPHLREYESGSFVDMRKILAPDEYERLQDASAGKEGQRS